VWGRKKLLMIIGLLVAMPALAQDYPRYRAIGSTYVPLESWVYPALERLAALQYINSDFRGMKPWTRTECARLTEEAGENITEALRRDEHPGDDVVGLHHALEREFAAEIDALGGGRNRVFKLESAYARVMSLSGPILNDSFHFGQTIANDYGRPSRRGTNLIAGASFRAAYGPFFAYSQGEYQHSPSAPPLPDSLRVLVAQMDQVPVKPPLPFGEINRFQLLDTYVGVNLKNWQISFGRQTLWWGTAESGGLLFSNNAEPVNMLRVNRVVPFRPPSFLAILGPVRVDFFVGRLGGHEFPVHPWIQGLRISAKVTRKLEYAATHTVVFGGVGRPNGADVFFKTLFPIRAVERSEQLGDNYFSFDFLYRFTRHVTWYGEFLASDDPAPFFRPSRMAINTGLYFPRLPWLRKMDLRLETVSTMSPCEPLCVGEPRSGPASFLHYWHGIYRNGYTNNGNILGNSIGRDGAGFQGQTTYWFSPTNKLQLGFKRTQVSPHFVPGGAQGNDFSVQHERSFKAGFYVRSFVQVERLHYPALFSGRRTNVAASLGFIYSPE